MMDGDILKKLSVISDEEKRLLEHNGDLETDIYTDTREFHVYRDKIAGSSAGNQALPVLVRTHTRFVDFPAHSHDYIEMMYVCSGCITQNIGNDTVNAKKGDIIILGKSTVHSINRAEIDDIGINIMISIDYFEALLNRLRAENILGGGSPLDNLLNDDPTGYFMFHTAHVRCVENLVENIIGSTLNQSISRSSILQHEMELLLCYLCFVPKELTEYSGNEAYTDEIKRIISNYIHTEYKNANLISAARLTGFTPTYLSRWIRAKTGFSFKQLLMEQKFRVASELLLTTDMPVNDIIISVGYENTSYFHKEFRKRFGVTPRTYRNQRYK